MSSDIVVSISKFDKVTPIGFYEAVVLTNVNFSVVFKVLQQYVLLYSINPDFNVAVIRIKNPFSSARSNEVITKVQNLSVCLRIVSSMRVIVDLNVFSICVHFIDGVCAKCIDSIHVLNIDQTTDQSLILIIRLVIVIVVRRIDKLIVPLRVFCVLIIQRHGNRISG